MLVFSFHDYLKNTSQADMNDKIYIVMKSRGTCSFTGAVLKVMIRAYEQLPQPLNNLDRLYNPV